MTLNKYYKEKDYIEELLKKRKLNSSVKSDLKTLAKYYKYKELNDKQIEDELYVFCNKKCKDWFNKVLHYRMIDNAVVYANKEDSKLIQIDGVEVTKAELSYIDSLEYEDLEKKILFTLLVINKLSKKKFSIRKLETSISGNYFGGSGEYSYKVLMDTLQEKLTRTYREKGIHKTIKKFNDDGLTRTTRNTALELLFISNIPDDELIVLEVTDFDTIGLYWDYYKGDKQIKWCEECKSELVRVTNHKNMYCIKCKNEKQKEWDRLSKQRKRNV